MVKNMVKNKSIKNVYDKVRRYFEQKNTLNNNNEQKMVSIISKTLLNPTTIILNPIDNHSIFIECDEMDITIQINTLNNIINIFKDDRYVSCMCTDKCIRVVQKEVNNRISMLSEMLSDMITRNIDAHLNDIDELLS